MEQFGLFVGFLSFQSSTSSCLTEQAVQNWGPVFKSNHFVAEIIGQDWQPSWILKLYGRVTFL